jgi:hypothetical protein
MALGAVLFLLGRCSAKTPRLQAESVRVDTLYVRDTITRETPVFTRVYVRDSIFVTVRDTLHRTDTVWLPREVKVYEDERYRAEVSGYQPSLDRIDIFVKDRIVTQDKTQVVTVKRNARWGIGIQAGYGATYYDGGVHTFPYIGVGLSWNILTF